MNALEALETIDGAQFSQIDLDEYIALVRSDLVELAEIKKRAEERRERYEASLGCILDETDMTSEIDYILKGEPK